MPFIPGDNWCICDLTGRKVLMSQTRKTWDGLRVWEKVWYPKHPQLNLRGIPEHRTVFDGRPRPVDLSIAPAYGLGSFCLISPNRTNYVIWVDDDGAIIVTQATFGTPQPFFYIGKYQFRVDDDGALFVIETPVVRNINAWPMWSPSRLQFLVTVDTDLAVLVNLVTGPVYMDGVFCLTSPNGTNYVVYIADDQALIVTPGTWSGPSLAMFIDRYKLTVDNDGALFVTASGERTIPRLRMVSPNGYEYMLKVDPDLALKSEREGHWWDVPVRVTSKTQLPRAVVNQVTEAGEQAWVEE